MPVCDVCNAPAGPNATTYSPSQFMAALSSGFRPPSQTLSQLGAMYGMDADQAYAIWFQNAIKSPTDWLLCQSCASRVR